MPPDVRELPLIEFLLPSPLLALLLLLAWTVRAWRGSPARPPSRARFLLAGACVWAWLCCTPAFTNLFVAWLEGEPVDVGVRLAALAPEPGRTIVALGSGEMTTPNGTPAPRLDGNGWERLHGAVRLQGRTGGAMVLAGGPGREPQASLAGQMGQVAEQMGVPPEAITLATGSRTTREDLLAARAVLPGAQPKIWLVTSAIHMPRALAVARRVGLDAKPFPVGHRQIRQVTWRSWLPDNAAPERMAMALHEVIGRLHYRSQGWSD